MSLNNPVFKAFYNLEYYCNHAKNTCSCKHHEYCNVKKKFYLVPNPCNPNPCQNSGICEVLNADDDQYNCICQEFVEGDDCEFPPSTVFITVG